MGNTNTQLTRIVAPSINETDYSQWTTVFDNINENFKKIATIPFIQGVQGDSYVLVEKSIWNVVENNGSYSWVLTDYGAVLLNSIFSGYTFAAGDLFDNCRTRTKKLELNDVNPLDFYETGDRSNAPNNNTLYFYVIIDDTGEEQQKELGQYYYFIDGRLKTIGDVYYSESSDRLDNLNNFEDLSGFYSFVPATTDDETEYYTKIDLLPTIYYDQTKNDICWKFKGAQTGISAIGVPGAAGQDAVFEFVKVSVDSINNKYSAFIEGVFDKLKDNTPVNQQWNTDSSVIGALNDGTALICIEDTSTGKKYIAFGLIYTSDSAKVAYWNKNSITDFANFEVINAWFYSLGYNSNSNAQLGLEIPSNPNRNFSSSDIDQFTAHVIKTMFISGQQKQDKNNLIFRLTKNVLQGATGSVSRYATEDTNPEVILDNYDLRLQDVNLSGGYDSLSTNTPYTKLSHGKVEVSKLTNSTRRTTVIDPDTSKFANRIEVGEDVKLTGTGNTKINFNDQARIKKDIATNGTSKHIITGIYVDNDTTEQFPNKAYGTTSNGKFLYLTVGCGTLKGGTLKDGTLNGGIKVQDANNKTKQNQLTFGSATFNSGTPAYGNYHGTGVVGIKVQDADNKQKVSVKPYLEVEGTLTVTDQGRTVGVGMPIGSIIMWYGAIEKKTFDGGSCLVPKGTDMANYWAVCDGTDISSISEFSTFKSFMGISKLPNFIGKFPLGACSTSASGTIGIGRKSNGDSNDGWKFGKGSTGGEEKHSISVKEMPRHRHTTYINSYDPSSLTKTADNRLARGGESHYYKQTINSDYTGGNSTQNNEVSGRAHNLIPPFLAVYYLIKYR